MNKFAGLKACLRKPCPWKEQCRNLNVPYGENGNTRNVNTRCKFFPFRRTYEMPGEPAGLPTPRTKARPEGERKFEEGITSKEEGRREQPLKRELSKEIKKIALPVVHEVVFRGPACSHKTSGENDEEKEKMNKARGIKFYKNTKS